MFLAPWGGGLVVLAGCLSFPCRKAMKCLTETTGEMSGPHLSAFLLLLGKLQVLPAIFGCMETC